jgi:hypothetical protein
MEELVRTSNMRNVIFCGFASLLFCFSLCGCTAEDTKKVDKPTDEAAEEDMTSGMPTPKAPAPPPS